MHRRQYFFNLILIQFEFLYLGQNFLLMNLISEPWPWYIGGPAIAAVLFFFAFFRKTIWHVFQPTNAVRDGWSR